MVQVLDSNGDKVTTATVNYIVYYYGESETWEEYTSGTMAHIGNGIYNANWTPESLGEFTFYAYCTNPKMHETYTYYVEAAPTEIDLTGLVDPGSGNANYGHQNNTDEQVFILTPDPVGEYAIYSQIGINASIFTQQVTIKAKLRDTTVSPGSPPDGYKTYQTWVYPDDFPAGTQIIVLDLAVCLRPQILTFQSTIAEGAARGVAIYYLATIRH